MRMLTSQMQDKSHILSLALSLSTIVILIGIFGLIVVANHRQKRRRQLKDILRAKNLGPVLESKKIAREVSDNLMSSKKTKPFPPKRKPVMRLPMNTPDIELQTGSRAARFFRKLDFNELMSSILYRMRKAEFSPSHNISEPALTSAIRREDTPKVPEVSETSFYYKESSVTTSESEKDKSKKSKEKVKSSKSSRASSRRSSTSTSSSGSTTSAASSASSSGNSEAGSYVSKISHFVTYTIPQDEKSSPESSLPPPLPLKPASLQQFRQPNPPSQPPQPPPPPPPNDFHGELKEKCMTFFSSVTRTKKDIDDDESAAAKDLDQQSVKSGVKTKL